MKMSIAVCAGSLVLAASAAASADDQAATTATTTTQEGPTGTTTTYERHDEVVHGHDRQDDRPRVRSGVGVDVIGAVGSTDESALGVGGRLEFVLPFGLALGASYTHHFANDNGNLQKSRITPLLAEVGFAIPVWRDNFEIRPMVGIGYAFVNPSSTGNGATNNNSNNANAAISVAGSALDVAPGLKIAYMASGVEVYTMPKYHIIKDLDFFALEVGAGLRF